MSLHAENLKKDPRLEQARQLIEAALTDQQKQITGPTAPKGDLQKAFQTKLEKLSELRGGAVWYPYLASGFGHGPYVELEDGSIKLDMITGIGVHYFGHLTPTYFRSHFESLFSSTIMQGHLQQQSNTMELLDLILQASNSKGAQLKHGVISSSGAMANENALKLGFSCSPGRDRVIAFEKCFHGRTMSMASMTDKAAYRQGLPLSLTVDYLPFYNPEHPEKSTMRCLKRLESLLNRYPNSHAMMALELIQGEGGFNQAPKEFFVPILEKLREHGVHIWFDEIQTLGRTTEIFAFQELELDAYADIVTFGKMAQVCGTLYRSELKPKPGLISQTYTSSSSAIQAGIEIFKILLEGDLFGPHGKIMTMRQHFLDHFDTLSKKYPQHFKGPHGHGAMICFGYGDGDIAQCQTLLKALFQEGVIAFLAGAQPAKIRFLPPMGCIEKEHIDQTIDCLDRVLGKLIQEASS